jgi:hypothetical protein
VPGLASCFMRAAQMGRLADRREVHSADRCRWRARQPHRCSCRNGVALMGQLQSSGHYLRARALVGLSRGGHPSRLEIKPDKGGHIGRRNPDVRHPILTLLRRRDPIQDAGDGVPGHNGAGENERDRVGLSGLRSGYIKMTC